MIQNKEIKMTYLIIVVFLCVLGVPFQSIFEVLTVGRYLLI